MITKSLRLNLLLLCVGLFCLPFSSFAQEWQTFSTPGKDQARKTEQASNAPAYGSEKMDEECFYSLNTNFTAGSISNSLACPGGDYQTLQIFDLKELGLEGLLSEVSFGVFDSYFNASVTVNVYTLDGPISYANMTLVASGTAVIPNDFEYLTSIDLLVPYQTNPDDVLVVELATPGSSSNGFIPGYNTSALESGTTYLASNFCNEPEPKATSQIISGFTDEALIGIDLCQSGFLLSEVGCSGDLNYDTETETYTLEATHCLASAPFQQDEISFAATELCGDGEIIAEVSNIQLYGWAGLMMRESDDQNSKKISLARDNGFYARREVRTMTGGSAYPQQFPAFGKNWLRLERNAHQFRGYLSTNGVNWQLVMATNMSMNECISVGMFLMNKHPLQSATADFNNVSVSEANQALQQIPNSPQVIASEATLSVYPNPSANEVTIDLGSEPSLNTRMDIVNAQGKVVYQLAAGQVNERRTELQLGHLPIGLYWLRIQGDEDVPQTKRIVIQRP